MKRIDNKEVNLTEEREDSQQIQCVDMNGEIEFGFQKSYDPMGQEINQARNSIIKPLTDTNFSDQHPDQTSLQQNSKINPPPQQLIFRSKKCTCICIGIILILCILAIQQPSQQQIQQVELDKQKSHSQHIHESNLDTNVCLKLIPYPLTSQFQFQKSYYNWYGKVGSNNSGRKYETGHFIERHVAVNGQCTSAQREQGKTVFYNWDQVIKALQLTKSSTCQTSDPNTFSYDFNISNSESWILGIDCRKTSCSYYTDVQSKNQTPHNMSTRIQSM